ncbi:707_t:CDS:2, partial [Funneliformis geosporum]
MKVAIVLFLFSLFAAVAFALVADKKPANEESVDKRSPHDYYDDDYYEDDYNKKKHYKRHDYYKKKDYYDDDYDYKYKSYKTITAIKTSNKRSLKQTDIFYTMDLQQVTIVNTTFLLETDIAKQKRQDVQ